MTRYPLRLPVIYFAVRCPLTSNRQMQNGQTLHSLAHAPHALIRSMVPQVPPRSAEPGGAPLLSKSMVLRAPVRHLPTSITTGHLSFFQYVTPLPFLSSSFRHS